MSQKIEDFQLATLKTMEKSIQLMETLAKRIDFIESKLNNNTATIEIPITQVIASPQPLNEVKSSNPNKLKRPSGSYHLSSTPRLTKSKVIDAKVPIEVFVCYKINCISDIDVLKSTFLIDIKIFLTWTDEALIGFKGDLSTETYKTNKDLFDPQIIVTNGHDLKEIERNLKIIDKSSGEVKLTLHCIGTLYMTSMELHRFPFDCQNLQVFLFI